MNVKVQVTDSAEGITWRLVEPPSRDWLNHKTYAKVVEAVRKAAELRRKFFYARNVPSKYDLEIRTL